MCCDYYVQTELVIEYLDVSGAISKTYTNKTLKREYITYCPNDDSDDDEDTRCENYRSELKRLIESSRKTKYLFKEEEWVKKSYKSKWESYLLSICPRLEKLIAVYKVTTAWERN